MNLELIAALLEGFVFYGMIYSLLFLTLSLLKRHYLKDLCKYGGTKEKPGRACVVCSYNKVTVKGTAASRVFCRLKAEAVEWGSKWPDANHLGLARPQRSPSAVSLIRSIRFVQVEPLINPVRSRQPGD